MGICRRQFGACLLAAAARPTFAAVPRAKLLILVLLEQLRPDSLDLLHSQFSPGGFRRILEKGATFHNSSHAAATFSSSAIATLATGAWPAQHGIVADHWYDRSSRRAVTPSAGQLLATTFASQIAAERGRVAVVSLDRSHAELFAGTPDAGLYWLDDDGRFATQSEAPEWLAAFNSQHSAESARNARWTALGARPEAPPLRKLAFDPAHPSDFLALYRASPYSQSAQFELAAELIARERFGTGPSVDLVCIIPGATARLGYETGARSPLMQQLILQLDRRLETFLGQLARTPGEGNFNLALTAAHGAPPEPPAAARERMAVHGGPLAEAVDKSLAASGAGRVEKYIYPFLYLNTDGVRDLEGARLAAARAAMQNPAVAGYYTAGGACSVRDAWERRFRNSFHSVRSGDVMLSYRPEYVESFGQNRGVSYGSLYNYDTRVPLFFFGPQFRAGNFERAVESVDFAPTLARAAGVAEPSSSVGSALAEALAE
jgi:hypothetical protein